MKKKRIFFLLPTLSCGGAERAAIALLNEIDYTKYSCDLMLFRRDDMYFADKLPNEVNILTNAITTDLCLMHMKHLLKFKYIKYYKIILTRFYCTFRLKLNGLLRAKSVFYDWDYIKDYLPVLDNKYDIAISVLEGNPNFYIVDKVKAKIKIGWIRADYEKWGYQKKHDFKYFDKLNYIFSVSEENKKKMETIFPEFKEKLKVMYNLLDRKKIITLSKEKIDDLLFMHYEGIKIISVGNLRYVKGYDRSIEACKILTEKGYDFRWFIVGEGNERRKLEKLIHKYHLKDKFILLGLKKNPYKYLAQSDIYVQASRHEGYSTTLREAKMLNVPIVITDSVGMSDQIKNNYTGVISLPNSENLALKIELLLSSSELRNSIISHLKESKFSNNKDELMKLINIFEDV